MRLIAKSLPVWVTLTLAFGQETSDLRIRVSVNLVQVDAIVTDSHGKPVPGLTGRDFRILLDGKPQTIRFCNYIESAAPRSDAPAPALALKIQPSASPLTPVKIRREEVRRTIVLFVDDLSLSSESVPGIRDGLRKFIEKQLRPGDLAAIVRGSAGLGALQDFTVDKQFLLAAANQVRWNAHGDGEADAYHPIGQDPTEISTLGVANSNNRASRFTLMTVSSLKSQVKGMAALPGRKSVIILSDRLPLALRDDLNADGSAQIGSGQGSPILSGMRSVVDECLRAGVVLYAVDTRGLNSLRAGARDNIEVPPSADPFQHTDLTNYVWQRTQARRDEYSYNQQGGLFLSSETGGFMVTEANRIDAAIERIMNDQNGYYLIGFAPAEETFSSNGGLKYHKLKVEALPPGLQVRSHKGFFGLADEESAPSTERAEPSLATVLESPFQSTGLGLYVRGTYFTGKKNASLIRATVVLNAHDLALSGPIINRSAIIHLLVRAFGVSGKQLEGGIDQRLRVSLNEEGYERALKYGLVYSAFLPADKPGPYQIRAACREDGTGKLGTAGDFIVIPQIKASKMALSGVVFLDSYGQDEQIVPSSGPFFFVPGGHVRFAFQVVNPPHKGDLKYRTRLFRDGNQVYESPVVAMSLEGSKKGIASGKIDIPATSEAGDYWMQIEVEDGQSNIALQWARLTVQ